MITRNFPGRSRVTIEKIEQNVAVQQRIQLRRLHSRRSLATRRETFPRVLDAPKNERRSRTDELRRKRSSARRTASAREIFSRRQTNASFLTCSWGKSTIVRMNDIVVRYHSPVKCTAHDVLSIKRKTPEDKNSEVRTDQDGHCLSIKDRGEARLLSQLTFLSLATLRHGRRANASGRRLSRMYR